MVKLKGELFFPSLIIGTVLIVSVINFTYHLIRQMNFDDDVIGLTTSTLWIVVINYITLSARKYVAIDVNEKTVHKYVHIFDLELGSKRKFSEIEKIFVNKSTKKRFIHMPFNYSDYKPSRVTIFESYYLIFLKETNGNKALLLEEKNKDQTLKRLCEANRILGTKIFDNTSGVAVLVDGVE